MNLVWLNNRMCELRMPNKMARVGSLQNGWYLGRYLQPTILSDRSPEQHRGVRELALQGSRNLNGERLFRIHSRPNCEKSVVWTEWWHFVVRKNGLVET